jgi:hypothetical protein
MNAIYIANILAEIDTRRATIATWVLDSLVSSGMASQDDIAEYRELCRERDVCQRQLADVMLRAARDRNAARA